MVFKSVVGEVTAYQA